MASGKVVPRVPQNCVCFDLSTWHLSFGRALSAPMAQQVVGPYIDENNQAMFSKSRGRVWRVEILVVRVRRFWSKTAVELTETGVDAEIRSLCGLSHLAAARGASAHLVHRARWDSDNSNVSPRFESRPCQRYNPGRCRQVGDSHCDSAKS